MWFKSWYAHPVEITETIPAGTHFHWIKFRSRWFDEIAILPGQYLNTDFYDGQEYYRRSYTPIRCRDGESGFLIQNIGGRVSSELFKKPVKSVIRISGASGKEKIFPPESTKKVIFITFDSGISFAFGMVSLSPRLQPSTVLFMGIKEDSDEIQKVMEKEGLFLNLEVIPDWNHLSDRVRHHSVNPESIGFYLSGDGQKIKFAEQMLLSKGMKPGQIFREIYFNHKAEPDSQWSFDQGLLPGKESW